MNDGSIDRGGSARGEDVELAAIDETPGLRYARALGDALDQFLRHFGHAVELTEQVAVEKTLAYDPVWQKEYGQAVREMRAAGNRIEQRKALPPPFRALARLAEPVGHDMVHIAERFAAGEPLRALRRYEAFHRHFAPVTAEIDRIASSGGPG